MVEIISSSLLQWSFFLWLNSKSAGNQFTRTDFQRLWIQPQLQQRLGSKLVVQARILVTYHPRTVVDHGELSLVRTQERHRMLLKIRRKQMSWKKRETMLLRKSNMKLRKIFILKRFNWTLIQGHSGQIVQPVGIQWKNMKMLWLTAYPHFPLTQRILRRV